MTYPIWVGVSVNGETMIGAALVNAACASNMLASSARLYGSQLPHWCAALVSGRWTLMTWTDARKCGAAEARPLVVRRY